MSSASAVRSRVAIRVKAVASGPPAEAWVVRELKRPEPNMARIASRAAADRETALALAACTASKLAPVRLGSSRALWMAAGITPAALYPLFDFFAGQLDSPNSILRWNATRALACLAPADSEGKLEAVIEKYLSPIPGPQMIGAANAIAGAAEIALARPELADRMARAILGVRRAEYKTEECRNIAIGHAIQAFGRFFEALGNQKAVMEFVRAQVENPRASTRRKAREFLKRHACWKKR
jgi:hypothetical protein